MRTSYIIYICIVATLCQRDDFLHQANSFISDFIIISDSCQICSFFGTLKFVHNRLHNETEYRNTFPKRIKKSLYFHFTWRPLFSHEKTPTNIFKSWPKALKKRNTLTKRQSKVLTISMKRFSKKKKKKILLTS